MNRRSLIQGALAALACLKLPSLFAEPIPVGTKITWKAFVSATPASTHPLFAGARVGRWSDLVVMYERADGSYATGNQWPDNLRFGLDPPTAPLELNQIRAAI